MKFPEIVKRIVNSKKSVLVITGIASTIAVDAGLPDVSDLSVNIVGALFGILIAVQGVLDFKFGSKADGTDTK